MFKTLLHEKLFVACCFPFSRFRANLRFRTELFPFLNPDSCVLQSKNILLVEIGGWVGFISISLSMIIRYKNLKCAYNVLYEFITVIREPDNFWLKIFCLGFFPPPENFLMRNGSKEYMSTTTFPQNGIVSFRSILLTEEFKINTRIMNDSCSFHRTA